MSGSAPRGRIVEAILLGWLVMIGFDFLLHGGILARLYVEPQPFLLPPAQAFRLIPVGYLSFLLIAMLLAWLTLEASLGGGVIGAAFSAPRLRGLVAAVFGLLIACVGVTVLLQSTGLAPAIRIEL